MKARRKKTKKHVKAVAFNLEEAKIETVNSPTKASAKQSEKKAPVPEELLG